MQELVDKLFTKTMNYTRSDFGFEIMTKIHKLGEYASAKNLSKEFSQRQSLGMPNKMVTYLESLKACGIVYENQNSVYSLENLGVIITNEATKRPIIREIGAKVKRYDHLCAKQKILISLLDGVKTRKEIYTSFGISERTFEYGAKFLREKELIIKMKDRIKFYKLERHVNPETLSSHEKRFYEKMIENDNEYVRAKIIYKQFNSIKSYEIGRSRLLKKGIISEKIENATYGLTNKGKSAASPLKKILDGVSKFAQKMLKNPKDDNKMSLAQAFHKVSREKH